MTEALKEGQEERSSGRGRHCKSEDITQLSDTTPDKPPNLVEGYGRQHTLPNWVTLWSPVLITRQWRQGVSLDRVAWELNLYSID